MHRINYAGGSVLTGTEIAKALLAYAEALAKNEDSATVEIPVRHADGTIGAAELLIGPASQLIAETEQSKFDEIVDTDTVKQFSRMTRGLSHVAVVESQAASEDQTPEHPSDVEFDEFTSVDPDAGPSQ
ncbi:MAG: hypothetical protein JWQ64_3277 [Subtercola sp.]|jgi:hypothetical protein|nr:hypothetical protein [Subtercola sp.]